MLGIHTHITLCTTVFNLLVVQPQGSQQMNPGQMLDIAGGRGDARKSLDFKQSKQQQQPGKITISNNSQRVSPDPHGAMM